MNNMYKNTYTYCNNNVIYPVRKAEIDLKSKNCRLREEAQEQAGTIAETG
jgi:hypothetical protein